jgi:alpha-D-ribose 1-methylphosphonate 5-triphosphate synthase subunit PhnL
MHRVMKENLVMLKEVVHLEPCKFLAIRDGLVALAHQFLRVIEDMKGC